MKSMLDIKIKRRLQELRTEALLPVCTGMSSMSILINEIENKKIAMMCCGYIASAFVTAMFLKHK